MADTTPAPQANMFDLPTEGDEEWGRVPRWPRYWVSTYGRVYSEPKVAKGAGGAPGGLMSPAPQGQGYLQITLQRAYTKVGRTVHSLVMEVHGPQPSSPQHNIINHIDGDKQNNRLGNLEWVTKAENRLHGALLQVAKDKGKDTTLNQIKAWINHA